MKLSEEIALLRSELAALRTEVSDLRRFQSWILGGLGVMGVVAAFMADKFKKLFIGV